MRLNGEEEGLHNASQGNEEDHRPISSPDPCIKKKKRIVGESLEKVAKGRVKSQNIEERRKKDVTWNNQSCKSMIIITIYYSQVADYTKSSDAISKVAE
jgi:hypothetical protein